MQTQTLTKNNKKEKACLASGGGNRDEFNYNKNIRGILYIQDFNKNQGDVIKIQRSGLLLPKKEDLFIKSNYIVIPLRYISPDAVRKNVYVWGVGLGEVKEWIDVETGEYRKTKEGKKLSKDKWEKKQEDNPIQIE